MSSFEIKINAPNAIKRVGDRIKFSTTYEQFNKHHIREIEWKFGDGSKSSQMSPQHEYDSPGKKSVKCTVNKKYTIRKTIVIHDQSRSNYDTSLCQQIESLIVNNIVLSSPSESDSKFLPGETINQRTLSVVIKTDLAFPIGTELYMRLVAGIDEEGTKTPITPEVRMIYTVDSLADSHRLDFTASQVPIPLGIIYLPNDVSTCPPSLIGGSIVKYVILLSSTIFEDTMSCAIPLVALVNSNATCDIRCEQVATNDTQTDDYPVKIYCQDTESFIYGSVPHCVTHCQAPRPILQYYEWSETGRDTRGVSITTEKNCNCN